MNRFELELHAGLPESRQRHLEKLLTIRRTVAHRICELQCWGLAEVDALDRHLALIEQTIIEMTPRTRLQRHLLASWVEEDAALIHAPGDPGTMECTTCRRGGRLAGEDLLDLLPDEPADHAALR